MGCDKGKEYTTDSRAIANILIYLIFKATKKHALKLDLYISMLNVLFFFHICVLCLAIRFSNKCLFDVVFVLHWVTVDTCVFITIIYTFNDNPRNT